MCERGIMVKKRVNLEEILKNKFKKEAFRPGQQEIITHLLGGTNTFASIPTGGGKSLCYQLLAALDQGQVLVISPLVALIDDQHKEAQKLGLRSVRIHSNLDGKEKQRFYDGFPDAQIIFLTPERLIQSQFWKKLGDKTNIKFLVIDEAHCMSQWGSDFRPDYTRIPDYLNQLNQPVVLAVTATATLKVQKDLIQKISDQSERKWFEYNAALERPNLNLKIFECIGFVEKIQRLAYQLNSIQGSIIVYFSLVQNLEAVSLELEKLGIRHVKYHGQLPSHIKFRNQKKFLVDGEELILATPAFGLGVNKPNIRAIIHFELPQSIEAYYQEIGRAGRDGKESLAELFYDRDDAEIHIDFLKWNHPEPGFISSVYNLILDHPVRFRQEGANFLREKLNFYNKRDYRAETALNLLKRWDVLVQFKDRNFELAGREQMMLIPDMDEELNSLRKKSSQMKLLSLIQLVERNKVDAINLQPEIIEYFKNENS